MPLRFGVLLVHLSVVFVACASCSTLRFGVSLVFRLFAFKFKELYV